MRPRAIAVEPLDDYMLLVTFSNNEARAFDVKPYFDFRAFQEIKNPRFFKKVYISGLSVEWPNGIDLCPDELYYDSIPVH